MADLVKPFEDSGSVYKVIATGLNFDFFDFTREISPSFFS